MAASGIGRNGSDAGVARGRRAGTEGASDPLHAPARGAEGTGEPVRRGSDRELRGRSAGSGARFVAGPPWRLPHEDGFIEATAS